MRTKAIIVAIATTTLAGTTLSCSDTTGDANGDDVTIVNFNRTELTTDSALSILNTDFLLLEEDGDNVIGDIACILPSGEHIFVSSDKDHSLSAFTSSGEYIGLIGSRGNGPGEYIDVTSFFVDSVSGYVGVYDGQQKKLLRYSTGPFEFMGERTYKHLVSNECLPVDGGLIWYNQAYEGEFSDSYFITTDTDGNVTGEYIGKEFKSGYITGSPTPLYSVDGKVHGYTPYDMTVYEYTGNAMKPIYSLRCEGFETPDVEFLKKISKDGSSSSLFSALSNSGYISYYDVMETPESLCANVIVGGETYIGLYDKTDGRTLFMSQDKLAGALMLGSISYFIPYTIDGCFLAVVEPEEVNTAAGHGNPVDPRLIELASGKTADSNPIIAKIRFI